MLTRTLDQLGLPGAIQDDEVAPLSKSLADDEFLIGRLVSAYSLIERTLIAKISPGLVTHPVTAELLIDRIVGAITAEHDAETGELLTQEPRSTEDIARHLLGHIAATVISSLYRGFMSYINDNLHLAQDEMRAAGRELHDKIARIGKSGGGIGELASTYTNFFDSDSAIDWQIRTIRNSAVAWADPAAGH
jgi:hypothetical protein